MVTPLSRTEHRLLEYLIDLEGGRATKEALLVDVWGYKPGVVSRTVFSTIERLRRKIERDPRSPEHLLTDAQGRYHLAQPPSPTRHHLLGRERLLEALAGHTGPIALTGPPGIGKTAIAAAVAAEATTDVVWVEVIPDTVEHTPLPNDEAALRLALGLGADADLRAALTERAPLLIVLDGISAAAADLLPVLNQVPGLTIIATARLDDGRWPSIAVGPLAPDAASELLQRRLITLARPVPAGSSPDGRPWLDALCAAVDHHPLAIHHIAYALDRMGPADLVERPDRLLLMQPSLQHTLQEAWDALAASDQRGLRHLVRAPGSLPLSAAEGLWPHDPTALPRLMRSGWVSTRPGPRTRVAMLAPLRDTVLGAGPPEPDDPLLSWAEATVAEAVPTIDGPQGRAVTLALRDDLPLLLGLVDLRGPTRAARLLEGLTTLVVRLGLDRRLEAWLAASDVPAHRVALGEVQLCTGKVDLPTMRAAVDLAIERPDLQGKAWIELAIGYRSRGDLPASLDALDRADALAQRHGLAALPARIAVERGQSLRAGNALQEAWTWGERGLVAASNIGNLRLQATARGLLGSLARRLGRPALAEDMIRAAIAGSEAVGDDNNAAHARCNLANLMVIDARWDEAEALLLDGLSTYRRQGYVGSEGFVHLALAHISMGRGTLEACVAQAHEARLVFAISHQFVGRAHANLLLGRLAHARADHDDARAFYADAHADHPGWVAPLALGAVLAADPAAALDPLDPTDPTVMAVRQALSEPGHLDAWVAALATPAPEQSFLR